MSQIERGVIIALIGDSTALIVDQRFSAIPTWIGRGVLTSTYYKVPDSLRRKGEKV
jgi:hypothetical protein